MMERKGTIVRCIDHLDISTPAKSLAKDMAEQIDMPIVFWIDHDLDEQYAMRSPIHHNQFWVCAQHQREQSEYERIILSNLYRGIQVRKRYLHPVPSEAYVNTLNQIEDADLRAKHLSLYDKLLKRISAFVTTVDAEYFLKANGFEVSTRQKQWLYDNRISLLNEYLEMQRAQPFFMWYWEVECINVLDYSRISLFHSDFREEIINRLMKIQPKVVSRRCIDRLSQMMKMINHAHEKYRSEEQGDVADWMTQKIVRIFELETRLDLVRDYALCGRICFKNGSSAEIYSYVPDDFDNKDYMIQGLRHVNEGILLLQEYYATFMNQALPDVHANLIDSDSKNAYANMINEEQYISVTSGLLLEVLRVVPEEWLKVPSRILMLMEKKEICRRLAKYAIFYIMAHEYAHIINGDCENVDSYQDMWDLVNAREHKADCFARDVLNNVLPLQYRPDMSTNLSSRILDMRINYLVDSVLVDFACDWCDHYFSRSTIDR